MKTLPKAFTATLDTQLQDIGTALPQHKAQLYRLLQQAGQTYSDLMGTAREESLAPYLPLFLTLNGKPYTLDHHYLVEPLFRTSLPGKLLMKCGRQVGKSTNISSQGIVQHAVCAHLTTLYILPLFEMARRLSSNVVKPMINESPIRNFLIDTTCDQNVLQRSFINQSKMLFSYAFTDCTRTRGISASRLACDEVQDLEWSFIPILRETIAASVDWGLEQYSGTPLTLDNTIEGLWQDSSMAEWIIPCTHCRKFNIPSSEFHVYRMIGSADSVERHGTGLCCAFCGKPIFTQHGRWVHQHPELACDFSGYHIPQIVLPLHCENAEQWRKLVHKRDKTERPIFLNEVLGESCDSAMKLVTLTDLRAASTVPVRYQEHEAVQYANEWRSPLRVLAIDWGGGGSEASSFTTLAVIDAIPGGKFHVIYGERLPLAASDAEETTRVLELFKRFRCHMVAHDYNGIGSVQESMLIGAGIPELAIMPMSYISTSPKREMITYMENKPGERYYYQLDKFRSLTLMCQMLRYGLLSFGDYESSKDLLSDFLHLIKETRSTRHAGSITVITKQPKLSDDFAHTVNYGVCAIVHKLGLRPDISRAAKVKRPSLTPAQEAAASPGWDLTTADFEQPENDAEPFE